MEKAWWLRPILLRRVSRLGSFRIHGVKIPSQTLWHTSKRSATVQTWWFQMAMTIYHQGLPTGAAELGESRLRCLEKSFCAGPKPSIEWPEHQPTIWSRKTGLQNFQLVYRMFLPLGFQCVLGPQIGDVWPLCCDARGSYYAITRPLWQCNAPSVPLLQAWFANSPKAGLGHMIVALTIGGVDFRQFCWTLAMFWKTWGIPIGFQSVENFPLGEWCHWWKSETAAHHQHGRMQYCILHDGKTTRDPKTCRKGFSGFKVLLRVF